MNWTGGALPRSRNSNARAALTAMQKKHFAKVRGKLLNGPRSSPDLDFSIFDHATRRDKLGPKRSLSARAHEIADRSQQRLERYREVAPIARRLDNIRARQHLHDAISPYGRQPGGQPSSDMLLQHASITPASAKANQPCSAGHKYGRSGIPGEPAKQTTVVEDSFEAKRQELLRREDWVGLANTKPAKIRLTNLEDRQLIGKRRRVEGAENMLHPQQTLKRRAVKNYPPESSDFGDISIRIGSQAWNERRIQTPPLRKARNSSGTFDDMLFGDDDIRIGSARSLDQPVEPALAAFVNGTEASDSLQTSWNGFSPQSNSTHPAALLQYDLRANSEAGPITAQEGTPAGHSRQQNSKLDAVNTATSPQENAWAGVPGLPLIFEDHKQSPIEISSDSSSESQWSPPMEHTNRPRQIHRANQRRLDLSLQECERDGERLLVADSPPFLPAERDEHREPEPGHSGIRSRPKPGAESITEDPLAEVIEENDTGIPEAHPAVHGVVDYKQPTSTQENRVPLPSPTEKAMKNSPYLVAEDEETIWRNFVFGNESEIIDHELEKPIGGQIDSPTNKSSILTSLSEPSDQSSLSVQASSAPAFQPRSQLSSRSLEADSILQEASSRIAVAISDRTFPSSAAEGSIPTISAQNQNGPDSSLIAHASASSSPIRSGHLATSPSSDELGATPHQPTFFFKRPSRYEGSQHDIPATIHIGQGSKGRRGRYPKATLGKEKNGKTDTAARDAGEDSSADEIID